MIISFMLNGESVEVDAPPHARAVSILRDQVQIRSIRMRCNGRLCGSCLILMDEMPVHTCMLPAFELRFRDVWTMEGISGTPGYQDIVKGFKEANLQLCSSCAPSRALVTEGLLRRSRRPGSEMAREAADSVRCDCASTSRILDGMMKAARIRERRSHGR